MERTIHFQLDLPATPKEVWDAWVTGDTFFAPESKIDPRPGGAYEMYFNPDAEPGSRGGESVVFLALQRPHMLSFTWNAPPELAEVRAEHTHVTVRLEALPGGGTRLHFREDGFGRGGQWEERIKYFRYAWGKVVLPRLAYRFDKGPVDWAAPPDLSDYLDMVREIGE
ncbi:MAG: SRPBCC domain-containing protein [Anaerolineales bacterium]|nr:SRPBCC domain-containing protein [Anaerolineales bacterium]